MSSRRFWTVLGIAISSLVLGIGSTALLGAAALSGRDGRVAAMSGSYPQAPPSCAAPALPGAVVDVTLTDMGGMMGTGGGMGPGMMGPGMGPGMMGTGADGSWVWPHLGMMGRPGMMSVVVSPATVPAGPVSLRVRNTGWLNHEVVVLPLAPGQAPGQRPIGPDGEVDESGSLGEAARTCGEGEGDGIAPGTTGWTTITLPPGRYELLCNIAGHYGAGMYTTLDVVPDH
ncbi:sulfocyanin-like copper-binding protein [Mycobacterium sp. CVI_P3]|uniref:Sulfocyanin-like copper-binding protein n=1 Tax=Mycobacterium pinniadriaticum TaxID=2994102 RepID=A0ABT3SLN2_9MYCO|nr:sulfocyanin-like copper-binding protein [Mycobacterium pinniadriaticum]MCX2933977.1 sulfocyanin-like copper-binding protein [Mycobacterium pinniadriaticum]MCX2940427.1 sulfocyanin-like copper-binding protein [Mycobacterium pinniadriaticum]